MNTKQLTTMTDDDWVVQIHDQADALPADDADFITPDLLGEMDAEDGEPFAPEMYFADRAKQALYAAGWATVRGHSYLTDAFLGRDDDAIEDDYEDIRRGM